MERLSNTKPSGLSGNALRTWGLLFLAAGIFGRGMLQTRLLGVGQASTEQLLAAMEANSGAATAAIALQALETCAVPIFAFLLVEGFLHTSNFKNYLLRVLGVAVLSEIPYNLAISAKLLDLGTRNPAFGLVLGLVVLYFYNRYSEKNLRNFLIKAAVTVAALVWTSMLSIEDGACLVVILAVLWAARAKSLYRSFAGASAGILCSLISPFYIASPMGVLVIHMYNGEKGNPNRTVTYLAYPALLMLIAGACWMVF